VSDGKFKRKNKTKMNFSPEVLDKLATALSESGYLSTRKSIEEVVRDIAAQGASGKGRSAEPVRFSISKALRGMVFAANNQANTFSSVPGRSEASASSRDEDINYFKKTLLTGTTPGSFLVPTIQAGDIIQLLASAHVIRQSGARIWPMAGIQKMNVPVESAAPPVVWGTGSGAGAGGTGATLTPSDPGLAQMAFDLKNAKALVAVPNELIAVSVPAIDQVVSEILALAFGQAEMNVFVTSPSVANAPGSVYAAAGTTRILSNNGSANGGAVKYSDLLAVVGQFFAQKGRETPGWFMHPTVFYKDIIGLVDANGRPIVTGWESVQGKIQRMLLGYPVYLSAEFPTNLAIGSGSNQSYILFTNPQYLHIADRGSLELAVSFERFFDANETAIRGVHQIDHGFAPAAAIIILDGVTV
jgi:HK97 family phage major capsid protein